MLLYSFDFADTSVDAAPVWGLPDGFDDDTPPSYVPPPPPPEEEYEPPPPEPVYSKVNKAPSHPTYAPPPKPSTQPAERKVVSVTSTVVTPEVYKIDLQNGDGGEEDEYKQQLQNVQYASLPPQDTGRSSPYSEKPKPAPKPSKPKNDIKSARERFFLGDNDPTQTRPGRNPYKPDQESYRAYRESRNKRSQSPGRQYQERTGIYGPKGWDSSRNRFQAVPVR